MLPAFDDNPQSESLKHQQCVRPTHMVPTWVLEVREVLLGKYPMPETPWSFYQAFSCKKSRDPLKVALGKEARGPWSPKAGTAGHRSGAKAATYLFLVMESVPRVNSKAQCTPGWPHALEKLPTLSLPVSPSVVSVLWTVLMIKKNRKSLEQCRDNHWIPYDDFPCPCLLRPPLPGGCLCSLRDAPKGLHSIHIPWLQPLCTA